MASTIKVSNISAQTSDKEIRDFFGFFGQIENLEVHDAGSSKSATVTFVKDSAAKTALLLDGTALGPSTLKVESATGATSGSTATKAAAAAPAGSEHHDEHHISQDDKPRAAVIAEFLSQGYVLGDNAIAKALELDQKHGVSQKFTTTLNNYNEKYKATEKARGMDNRLGVTNTGLSAWNTLNHYFEQALGTPTGQKVRAYYTSGSKQVLDVHNEARRLADIRKQGQAHATGSTASGVSTAQAEKMHLHDVGDGKTACDCGGEGGICACQKGKCSCGKGCSKDVTQAQPDTTGATTTS